MVIMLVDLVQMLMVMMMKLVGKTCRDLGGGEWYSIYRDIWGIFIFTE